MGSDMVGMDEVPGTGWLLFSPSGRIGRQAYAMSMLLWLALLGAAIALMLAFDNSTKGGLILAMLALVAISIATLLSYVMLSIKRLHDMGFSALFVLLLFVPAVALVVFIALLFWPSAPPNAFGEYSNRPK